MERRIEEARVVSAGVGRAEVLVGRVEEGAVCLWSICFQV